MKSAVAPLLTFKVRFAVAGDESELNKSVPPVRLSVSLPVPPSKVTADGIPASLNVSFPAPPSTMRALNYM